jgi:hypothetical protein
MKTCIECEATVDDGVRECPHCSGIDFVTAAPPPLSAASGRAPSPGLLISVGNGSQVAPAEECVLLGRNPRSVLHEQFAVYPNVSGVHATARRTGARLTVVDSGRNGTWHADTALEPGREYQFPLPITLRFGSNCYVHFAATTLDEPGSAP